MDYKIDYTGSGLDPATAANGNAAVKNGVSYAANPAAAAPGPAYYSRLPETKSDTSSSTTPTTPATPTSPKITPTQDVQQPAPFDETTARNDAITQREGSFNALDELYAGRIADATKKEQELGDKDLARTNTISALTGMAGGIDAQTNAGKVEKKTADIIQQKTDSLNREKQLLIAGIYDKIDANVARQKEVAQQNERTDRTKLVDDMNRSAQSNIMEFATHAIPWDEAYKDPDFQDEVKRTGKTAFEMQTLYNNSLPGNMKPTVLFSGFKGNDFVQITRGADGKVSTTTEKAKDLGISSNVDPEFHTINGKVYWSDKNKPLNDDGTPRLVELGTSGTGAHTVPTEAPTGMTAADIKAGADRLNSQGAYQGYASPYLYRDMFDFWTKNGGSRAAFIKAYPPKQYINPTHNTLKDPNTGEFVLPEYLRTTPTKAATQRGS